MSAEADLMRTVIAAGDDLTPRLVYADWLDDHGQPERAAFIRDQVLVAATPTDTPARREAARRAYELERKYGKRWAGPVAKHCHDWQFRGGFPDMIGLTAAKLRRNADKLFAHAPIRSLLVTKLDRRIDTLEYLPVDNSLTRLSLWGSRLTAAHLPWLADLTTISKIHTLSLLFNELNRTASRPLAESLLFQRLTRIELGGNPIPDRSRDKLRRVFADKITFDCDREADYLYKLRDERLFCGVGPDASQCVILGNEQTANLAQFDLAGNVLRVETQGRPKGTSRYDLEEVFGLGFKLRERAVRVKCFRFADGTGVFGLSTREQADFEGRSDYPILSLAQERLDEWLDQGLFRWDIGDIAPMVINRWGVIIRDT